MVVRLTTALIGLGLFGVALLSAQPNRQVPVGKVSTGIGGTITGKVFFQGTPIKTRPISMRQDRNCEAAHKDKTVYSQEFVLNKNGTLKWVLVHVKGVKGQFEPPKTPAVLDQVGCFYKPRVIGVMVGQVLEIRNSDGFMHNVHFVSKKNPGFNLAQPTSAMVIRRTFQNPELPPDSYMKCDVHPWMVAWVGIFDHPFFAVTGDDGSFTIKGVPAGTYEVEAWHERLGRQIQKVTVKEGTIVTVNFTFKK